AASPPRRATWSTTTAPSCARRTPTACSCRASTPPSSACPRSPTRRSCTTASRWSSARATCRRGRSGRPSAPPSAPPPRPSPPAPPPAAPLVAAAAAARQAGARTVALGVGFDQTVKAPAGDYWAGRDTIARLGLVPLAVAAGEEARAALSLHLVVAPGGWE